MTFGTKDRYWVDIPVSRADLDDQTFFEAVNSLTDMWEREVRDRGTVPVEGQRVTFACVIEDIPRDMIVIRVTGDVRRT